MGPQGLDVRCKIDTDAFTMGAKVFFWRPAGDDKFVVMEYLGGGVWRDHYLDNYQATPPDLYSFTLSAPMLEALYQALDSGEAAAKANQLLGRISALEEALDHERMRVDRILER